MALQSRFRLGTRATPGSGLWTGAIRTAALGAAAPARQATLGLAPLTVPGADSSIGPQAMPVDPQFGADVNAAQRNLSQTLEVNQAQRGQLGQTYGFGVDGGGRVIDDPTNPYSRAAALQLAATQRARGNTNSYAARGQLYAGSLQNAQNENEHQRLMGRDALIRQFMDVRGRLDQSDTAAQNAYASASEAAQAAAIQRALEARPAAAELEAAAPAAQAPDAQALANAAYGGAPRIQANYKSPSGKIGTLKTYPNGRKVFIANG